jgi:hypothetical protein
MYLDEYNSNIHNDQYILDRLTINRQKIRCITTNEIFNSLTDIPNKYNNISISNISTCINGRSKSAGKLKDGTKLKWEKYYD